ncbi:HAD superfamily hydrolase (TIGR01484 family) [Peribacillus deserti]|uniref:HAD superfamily hydrolase (TIGR01484 family) n=1 Tax=Peribacillus deserti TaxID=673318 RepID=A0ABS2QCY8_9BACI|nr:Cof-type HAD-IIB family hydrolase [Peribacillus deserti]MBM7691025.1 HAD superfamily hydrolase (TIGR01484 family) [Peribacillus deserti]
MLEKKIKLVALDMDGTLLNDKHEISDENVKAISEAQEKGVHVVLSTGRALASCKELSKSLNLSSYLVTVNGSEVYNEKGELIERNAIDTEHIQMMHELSKQHKARIWGVTTDKVWYEGFPEDITAHEWLKFGFEIEDDESRNKVLDTLTKTNMFEISNSSPTNIEVNAIGINKARALRHVCERLGITVDEMMAVGDSLNDIAMITEAGMGVAMGNAQEKVKEAADWITGTNLEHGVAQAIRRWVLEQ